jgi:hypothetical protein
MRVAVATLRRILQSPTHDCRTQRTGYIRTSMRHTAHNEHSSCHPGQARVITRRCIGESFPDGSSFLPLGGPVRRRSKTPSTTLCLETRRTSSRSYCTLKHPPPTQDRHRFGDYASLPGPRGAQRNTPQRTYWPYMRQLYHVTAYLQTHCDNWRVIRADREQALKGCQIDQRTVLVLAARLAAETVWSRRPERPWPSEPAEHAASCRSR